jgi:thiamine biosynthesis lipoprotein
MQEFAHRFRAMGTHVGLWLWHHDQETAQAALLQAERFFAQTEVRLSRFLPNSELSRLNRAGGRPFKASPLLFQLVHNALKWRARTNGIFDPTILNALIAQGYDRSFEQIGTSSHGSATWIDHVPGQVKLRRSNRTITMDQGVGLDLGGLAKGWAVQHAASQLGRFGPAMVDGGGDIACTAPPPDQPFWAVNVADPHAPHHDIATLFLNHEAVATSSQTGRRWLHRGQQVHHLIDPRTGVSAVSNLASVTIIASRLPDAEIHAKVVLILGEEAGMDYLAKQSTLATIMVTIDGRQLTYGNLEGNAYVYPNTFNPDISILA